MGVRVRGRTAGLGAKTDIGGSHSCNKREVGLPNILADSLKKKFKKELALMACRKENREKGEQGIGLQVFLMKEKEKEEL